MSCKTLIIRPSKNPAGRRQRDTAKWANEHMSSSYRDRRRLEQAVFRRGVSGRLPGDKASPAGPGAMTGYEGGSGLSGCRRRKREEASAINCAAVFWDFTGDSGGPLGPFGRPSEEDASYLDRKLLPYTTLGEDRKTTWSSG